MNGQKAKAIRRERAKLRQVRLMLPLDREAELASVDELKRLLKKGEPIRQRRRV